MNPAADIARIKGLLLPVLTLLVSAGCVSIEQTLTLNADGSGEAELEYEISESTKEKFTAVLDLADELAIATGKDPMAPGPRRDLFPYLAGEGELQRMFTGYKDLGIRVQTLTVRRVGTADKVLLHFSFPDLRALSKTAFFANQSFSLDRTRDGDYEFKLSLGRKSVAAMPDLADPEVQDILRPMLAGFRVVSTVKTPGRIIYTTSRRATARMAIWSFDFAQDINALANLQRRVMRLTFAGSGMNLRGLSYEAP